MKKLLFRYAILTVFGLFGITKVQATVIGVKPAATSDDWAGSYNANPTTFAGVWLLAGNGDSTIGTTGPLGLSLSSYSARAVRFVSVSIPQGATIDTAAYFVRSGCNACTDSVILQVAAQDADAGTQVTDSAGFRARWASKTSTRDTAWLSTVTSWGLGAYVIVPFKHLKTVLQTIVNRAGWTSGSSIVMMIGGAGISPAVVRWTRTWDYGTPGTNYDSLYISYTAGGAPPGGSGVIARTATARTATAR